MYKRIKGNLWSNVKNPQGVIVLANIPNSLWKVNSHMYKHSSALWESCSGRAYCIDSIAGGCVYFQFKTMRQTTGCVSEMRISIRSGRCMRNGKQECDSEKSSLLLLKFLNLHVDPDQEVLFEDVHFHYPLNKLSTPNWAPRVQKNLPACTQKLPLWKVFRELLIVSDQCRKEWPL